VTPTAPVSRDGDTGEAAPAGDTFVAAPAGDAGETAPAVGPATLRRARRFVVAACVGTGIAAPAALAAIRWPAWWTDIAPEDSPMTWLQSVVLVVAAVVAGLTGLSGRLAGTGRADRGWFVLAAGFVVLAVDERFAIHERVRDGYLAPRGIAIPFLPWVAPGDFLILIVGVTGLSLLPMVVRAVRSDRVALRALLVGVGLAVVAVGMDSIDPSTWTVAQERVQQTAEECVELASGLALLTCVLLSLVGRLPRADRGGI